jgi:two-component system sensor histidine kinase KdpD
VNAVASLTAIALERVRSFDRESRADAARQSEQLRAAVLDALAHAFKTPLTAIRVASSGLLETSNLAEGDAGLVKLIDDESERLNQLTTRLLQMARIDASELRVHDDELSVAALLADVVASCDEQLRGHPVEIVAAAELRARGDRAMLSTAILQFVDNAAKYSTPGSAILVSAAETDGDLVVSVHNEGPPIQPAERERVFERFYRSNLARHGAPGTGLGLSIVKKTAEAHRGRTWVLSEDGSGTTFFLAVPQGARDKT